MKPPDLSRYSRAAASYWVDFVRSPFGLARLALARHDFDRIYAFYHTNVSLIALIVFVKTVVRIPRPLPALAHAIGLAAVTMAAGRVAPALLTAAIGAAVQTLRLPERPHRVHIALLTLSPWFLAASLINAVSWTRFLAVMFSIAGGYAAIHALAEALGVRHRQAFGVALIIAPVAYVSALGAIFLIHALIRA